MINGQFVTLYSVNGQTWLSSPEDIPNTMARLDHTRITLTDEKEGEKDEKSAKDKDQKGEKGDKNAKEEKAAAPPPKAQGSQYRMKGPKPRPILRQGGKVVEGTPIEPVSASSVNIKGAMDTSLPQVKLSPMEQGLRRGKIVAPIAQRRPGKPKVAPPPKTVATSPAKGAPVMKGKAPVAPPQKIAKGLKVPPKGMEKAKKIAPPVKASSAKTAKPAAAPKKFAKPVKVAKAPKKIAKKPAPKKVASKVKAKKRSR
jgi:adenylate kinase